MTEIKVPFETAEEAGVFLTLDVPDRNMAKSFAPKEPRGVGDLQAALLRAIESPIKSKKFSDLLGAGKKVVFIIENQFRAAPAKKLLPPLLKQARQAGSEVSIAVGCGKVPPLSPEEIREKLGEEVLKMAIPIVCNDVNQPEKYTFLGNTRAGTPLWILKSVAEADVIVTISTTQAALWGYGGSGMIIPAVSGNETIETNHVMSLAPDCIPGNNDCRMQLDKYEALQMAGVHFGINVVVANNWDILYINAGAPAESHREAVKFYDGIYKFGVKKEEEFDIIIAGSTGPTDHLFFHTGWAAVNCEPITKEGGTIIFCSPCPGYGSWPGFALMDLMKDYMPPTAENHARVMKAYFSRERELWAGCIWYPIFRAMLKRKVEIVTRSENLETAKDIGLSAHTSIEGAFKKAVATHGENARVAFVPFGRYTVFQR